MVKGKPALTAVIRLLTINAGCTFRKRMKTRFIRLTGAPAVRACNQIPKNLIRMKKKTMPIITAIPRAMGTKMLARIGIVIIVNW